MSSDVFEKLIEYFLKFPGIGPRQAKRFAYFLASQDKNFTEDLSEEILDIKNKIKQCPSCFRFYGDAGTECTICSSLNRDKSLLTIVEKDVDLENIERAGIYNGKYFVLGGVMILGGGGKENGLRFKQLFDKTNNEKPREIILALSANVEGENTGRYIEKILEPLKIKISKLGRGLSTGTELEYSDSETIKNALEGRK
jgi:recombination protein RecR